MAGAANIRAGGAFVEIFTKDGAFQKGMTKIENRLRATAKSLKTIGSGMMVGGAALAGPILAAAQSFASFGSSLQDMKERTGVATEALSVLQFAAGQTGTDMAGVETAVKKMQKAISQAGNGSGEAVKALKAVGLSAASLSGMSADQQMGKIADGLMRIKDPGERAAAAMAIFGKSGTSVLPMLSGGSEGMAAFAAEAKRLGLVMDGETAKKADRLDDAIHALKSAMAAAFREIGSAVAPALTSMAQGLATTAASVGKFIQNNQGLVQTALKVGATLFAVGAVFVGVSKAISIAASAFSMMKAAMSLLPALMNPVGLAIIGIVAAVAIVTVAARSLSPAFKRETDAMMTALSRGDFSAAGELMMRNLELAFATGWASIKQSFKAGIDSLSGFFSWMWDKAVEGLDRFLGFFGTDIITLQGKLEKLGLYFKAAFNWKFWATGLKSALKDVDRRMEEERKRGPTADARAKNRDAARKAEYDELAKRREEEAAKDEAAIDEIRKRRDEARKRAIGDEKKADDAAAGALGDAKKALDDLADQSEEPSKAGGKQATPAATLGTFSAALLGQMGIGTQVGAADRTAEATEETAKNTGLIAATLGAEGEKPGVVKPPVVDAAAMKAGVEAAKEAAGSPAVGENQAEDPVVSKLSQAIAVLMEHSRTLTSIDRKIGQSAMAFT